MPSDLSVSRPAGQTLCLVLTGQALILMALLAASLTLTGGHFTYALDDPYIHLALARNLPGHYGVSSSELAAASSSLLYPWLLLPFAHAGLELAPLLINLLAGGIVIGQLAQAERELALFPRTGPVGRAGFVLLLAGCLNLSGLILTGMEHTLHLAATLAVGLGLLRLNRNQPPGRLFMTGLLLGPLLRPEGLAVSGVALIFLFIKGKGKPALAAGLAIATLQLAHAAYLHHLGLPWLPGSMLIKLGEGGLTYNLGIVAGWILLALSASAGLTGLVRRQPLPLLVALVGVAHLLFGRVDWLDRYHPYVLALLLLTLLDSWQDAIRQMASRLQTGHALLVIALLLVGESSLTRTLQAPLAQQDVWLQHAQLARLVRDDWQQPVATMDIGLMSWDTLALVTDLYGLGSEEIRHQLAHDGGWTATSLNQLVTQRGIRLIIASDRLLHDAIPATWIPIGVLTLQRPGILVDDIVVFYATSETAAGDIDAAIARWQPGLPPGVVFERH